MRLTIINLKTFLKGGRFSLKSIHEVNAKVYKKFYDSPPPPCPLPTYMYIHINIVLERADRPVL
jgi:hypothetical protein